MPVLATKTSADAKLVVKDPRAHEALTTAGARFDYDFFNRDDWHLRDCEVITGSGETGNGAGVRVGLLGLRHYIEPYDMELDHWTYSHYDGKWLKVHVAEQSPWWLQQSNTGYSAYPRVYAQSARRFGNSDGSFSLQIKRFQPAYTGSLAGGSSDDFGDFEFAHTYCEVSSDGTYAGDHYMVLWPSAAAGDSPLLCFYDASQDAGERWRVIHRFQAQGRADDSDLTVRPIVLSGTSTGLVVFTWEAGGGEEEVLYLPDWPTQAPYMRVGGRAIMWAWLVGRPVYAQAGYAYSASTFGVQGDITAAHSDVVSASQPSGTSASLDRIGATGAFQAKLSLTGDGESTPLVQRATFVHEPVFGSAVTTDVFDSSTDQDGNKRWGMADWTQATGWRGAQLSTVVRDKANALDFRVNQLVTLSANHSGVTPLVDQFQGRIEKAIEVPKSKGRLWKLQVRDETFRLGKKKCAQRFGSLAGMRLADAVTVALTYPGIAASRIVCLVNGVWKLASTCSGADTPLLPWSDELVGQLRFADGVSVSEVLDRLCEHTAWTWGVNSGPTNAGGSMVLGSICFWPHYELRTYTDGDQAATFGLTGATSTSAQYVVSNLEFEQDGAQYANHVTVTGSDAFGRPRTAWARRKKSTDDVDDQYFVGDQWFESERAEDSDNPGRRVNVIMGDAQETFEGATWDGWANPSLRPDSILKVEVRSTEYRLMRLLPMAHQLRRNAWRVRYGAQCVQEV